MVTAATARRDDGRTSAYPRSPAYRRWLARCRSAWPSGRRRRRPAPPPPGRAATRRARTRAAHGRRRRAARGRRPSRDRGRRSGSRRWRRRGRPPTIGRPMASAAALEQAGGRRAGVHARATRARAPPRRRRAADLRPEPRPARPRRPRSVSARTSQTSSPASGHDVEGLPAAHHRGHRREPLGARRVVAGGDGPGRAGQRQQRVDALVGRRARVRRAPAWRRRARCPPPCAGRRPRRGRRLAVWPASKHRHASKPAKRCDVRERPDAPLLVADQQQRRLGRARRGARRARAGRPRARTSPPFMSIEPEPSRRSPSRRSGWWSAWPIDRVEVADEQQPAGARPASGAAARSGAWSGDEHGGRSTLESSGASAAATAAASSARARRPRATTPRRAPRARARRGRRWRRRGARSRAARHRQAAVEALLRRAPRMTATISSGSSLTVSRSRSRGRDARPRRAGGAPTHSTRPSQNSRPTRTTGKWWTLRSGSGRAPRRARRACRSRRGRRRTRSRSART